MNEKKLVKRYLNVFCTCGSALVIAKIKMSIFFERQDCSKLIYFELEKSNILNAFLNEIEPKNL